MRRLLFAGFLCSLLAIAGLWLAQGRPGTDSPGGLPARLTVDGDGIQPPVLPATNARSLAFPPGRVRVQLAIEADCYEIPGEEAIIEIRGPREPPDIDYRRTTREQLLEGLEPGRYSLRVRREGWSAGSIDFIAGEEEPRSVDLTVRLVPLLGIEGLVLDDGTGAPVTSFSLDVECAFVDGGVDAFLVSQGNAVEAPEGYFCFPILEQRTEKLRVLIRATGYEDYLSDWSSLQGHLALPTIRLRTSQEAHYDLSGVVLDTAGLPVAGATVRMLPDGEALSNIVAIDGKLQLRTSRPVDEFMDSGEVRFQTVSDERGRFSIQATGGQSVGLVAYADGYLPWTASEIATESDRPLQVVLARGASIRGFVHPPFDPALRPSDSQVHVVGEGLHVASSVELHEDSTPTPFGFTGLPAGDYDLVLMARRPSSAHFHGEATAPLMPALTTRIRLGDEEERRVDLHYNSGLTGGGLRGTVALPAEIPEGRVIVQAFPAGAGTRASHTVWLDSDGTFGILNLEPGEYGVLAAGVNEDGSVAVAAFVSTKVVDGRVTEVDVPDGDRLRVVGLLDRPGRPREIIGIGCIQGPPELQQAFYSSVSVVSNPDGAFKVYGLPFGGYRLRTRDEAFEAEVVVREHAEEVVLRGVR